MLRALAEGFASIGRGMASLFGWVPRDYIHMEQLYENREKPRSYQKHERMYRRWEDDILVEERELTDEEVAALEKEFADLNKELEAAFANEPFKRRRK